MSKQLQAFSPELLVGKKPFKNGWSHPDPETMDFPEISREHLSGASKKVDDDDDSYWGAAKKKNL